MEGGQRGVVVVMGVFHVGDAYLSVYFCIRRWERGHTVMQRRSRPINHIIPEYVDIPNRACSMMTPLYQIRDLVRHVQAMNLMLIWMS
jgi:hypothetical protein